MSIHKSSWKLALAEPAGNAKPMPAEHVQSILQLMKRPPKIDWPPLPIIRRRTPAEYINWVAINHPEILREVCQYQIYWKQKKTLRARAVYLFTTSN